ncbi:Rhodanese-like protein [Gymnopus androsaceus JB14]|uniref:Rhodanese-like protein n=1 Tax=Gymnopus androsaceus JB14 TaxID=1447944 RepID=A0A6A4IK26_9AGAR|nr:Rhodanese-like protein [Gymnopus androsaceus JB14]
MSFILRALRRPAFRFMASSYSTTASEAPLLISPSQLNKDWNEKQKDIVILDTTWFMPNAPRDAYNEFQRKRIPGAQFLDLDKVASSHELGLKHMMPSNAVFADNCENFGIRPSTHVVLYDTHGVFSSPRALFMFRSFGHTNSSILNGGLPSWNAESFTIETNPPSVSPPKSQYFFQSYEQMIANSSLNPSTSVEAELVLDARSAGRFTGKDAEPRPGLSSGHMPNSFSLPFGAFLKTVQGPQGSTYTVFREPSEIRDELDKAVGAAHAERIVKGEATAVTTCGSGMTAGILWLGLKILNAPKIGLYDESWTGYAMRETSKIEKA